MSEANISNLEARVTVLERKDAVADVRQEQTNSRLDKIEDSIRWLSRLVFGVLILAVVQLVLEGGGIP